MAVDTRTPVSTPPVSPPPELVWRPAHPWGHWGLRGALATLGALVGITAIYGAIYAVPVLPRSYLQQGILSIFPDYTIPALALGTLCGGSALVALVTVLVWPRIGALAAVVAGVFMIGFELVEILVVGFTPVQTPDQFPAWLQVIYLVIGAAMAMLGARLWRVETGSYRPR